MDITVSNYTDLYSAVSTAVAGEPLNITFGNSIKVPVEGTALKILANTHIKFIMENYKLWVDLVATPTSNYSMVTVENGAEFVAENGIFEYNGPGDASYARFVNTITSYGITDLNNCSIINKAPDGISSAIDVLAGVTRLTSGQVESKRYGVRVYTHSESEESAFIASGSTFECGSTGIFVHQPSNNTVGLGRFELSACKIVANKGIYFWDCMTTYDEGESLLGILKNGTSVKSLQSPTGSDLWLPGFKGYVIYDGGTGAKDGHIKITIEPRERATPISTIEFFKKYKMRG